MDHTIIMADQTWALWAALLGAAALGLWAERTRWGARFSGGLVAMLAGFAMSNLKLIPPAAPVYTTVWTFLVPLAIPLLLLHVDLKRVMRESMPTVIAFCIGAVGCIIGTLVAFLFVPLGAHAWQVAAIFNATYVGGAANYMPTADAVGLGAGALRNAGVAADQLMLTGYLTVLFALPAMRHLRRRYREHTPRRWGTTTVIVGAESRTGARINLPATATVLTIAVAICAVGYFAQARMHWHGTALLVIAGLSLLVAGVFARRLGQVDGTEEMGTLLMLILFATIGAGANIGVVLDRGPLLFIYAAVILVVQLAVILVAGWFARLSLPEIVIGANAGMGGALTAAAMAAARRWDALVVPGLLCGVLGYAIGPQLGVLIGHLLR